MKNSGISRRNFLGKAATVGVAGVIVPSIITSCSRGEAKKTVAVPTMLDQAPDGPVIRAGVIGCGGRGTGAAINFLSAGPNLQVVALGDTFQDRVDQCRADIMKEKGQDVPLDKCFVGFDAYQKVIDAGVDIVIVAKMAGHSNIQTTARYDRRLEEAKRRAAKLLQIPYPEQKSDLKDVKESQALYQSYCL